MVHDFPDEAKFLKPDERARVLRRLAEDQQASATHEDFNMNYFWQSVKDVKTWLFAIGVRCCPKLKPPNAQPQALRIHADDLQE